MIVSDKEIQKVITQIDIEPENIQNEERRQRYEILLRKLRILFNSNGFTKELMEQMDTKYFVDKGFTIPESILLTKPSSQIHPTVEEIRQLELDNQTNILKLEYQNDSMSSNQYYIIVMGPTNRGKTTFIFNIINKFFNISRDSLYRIKKRENQEQQNYFDEYIVKLDEKKTYVFADFRGLGDFKLDFLGLESKQKTTLYTEVLNYFMKHYNQILAVLFCNSSSINRLGQDEKYQLQRFFEVLPQDFIHKVLLVLTYCTDNQPLMTVYQNFEGMPEQLRVILESEYVQQDKKFWFGINNANLYNSIDYDKEQEQRQEIEQQQQQIQEMEEHVEQEDEQFQNDLLNDQMPKTLVNLLRQYSKNNHQQLKKIVDVEKGNIDDNYQGQDQGGQEIDLPEYEWPKLYYNQMLTTLDEFLVKLKTLEIQLQNNRSEQSQLNFFGNKKKFEEDIINLQFEFKRLARLKQQNYPLGQLSVTTYIKNQFLNNEQQTATRVAKKLTKFMFCRTCSKFCHEVCHLDGLDEIYNNQKMCRKLDFYNFQKHIRTNPEIFAECNIEEKKKLANDMIKCKKCIKNNPEGTKCKIDDHQISNQIQQSEQKMVPYLLRLNEVQLNQRNIQNSQILRQQSQILLTQQIRNPTQQENFITEYQQYRQSKQLLRLFQQKVISLEVEQKQKIKEIRDSACSQQNQGLAQVNLNQRFEFLNAMQVQLQNNSLNDDFNLKLEEVLKVYSHFKPPQNNNNQNQLKLTEPNQMEQSFGQLPNQAPLSQNPPLITIQQNHNFQQSNDLEQDSPVRGLRNSSFLNASEGKNLLTHGQNELQ